MGKLKTKGTNQSVSAFLKRIENRRIRSDCRILSKIIVEAAEAKPKMWGTSIVGFGSYTYKYASGRKGEWILTGFSLRKPNLTLHMMSGFGEYDEVLAKLGKHKTARPACTSASLTMSTLRR